MAVVLSAELRRRQAPPPQRPEVGPAGHADWRYIHHHRRRLHDDDRQCRTPPRVLFHRSGADGGGSRQSLRTLVPDGHTFADDQCSRSRHDGDFVIQCLGLRRGEGLAPHSLQKSIKDAPGFYGVYVLCVGAAAGLVLIPRAPLQLIILSVQVLAGIMLPSAIIFLQLLLNDREMLGERFANKPWNNVVNWTIIIVLFALSLVLAIQVVAPKLFPAG